MDCPPVARYGATGCTVDDKFYLIGGYLDRYKSKNHEPVPCVCELDIFNEKTLAWSCRSTRGVSPPGVVYAASVVYKGKLYYFGGYDCKARYNALFCLDLRTFEWQEITAENPEDAPMPKCSCGMVVDEEGNLFIFGGYGKPVEREGVRSKFQRNDGYERGWTNELHCFNLETRRWRYVKSSGRVPPPMSGFTFTWIGGSEAILFGGYSPRSGTSNAVYMVNLENGHWSRVQKPADSPDTPWPSARKSHCAVSLPSPKEGSPLQLLVMGGQDEDEKPLNDVWTFDADRSIWKEVALPTAIRPRCEHVMGTLCPGSERQETLLLLFSGVPRKREREQGEGSNQDAPIIAETTLLQLESTQSSEWKVKETLLSPQITPMLARLRIENQQLQQELVTVKTKLESSIQEQSIAVNETNNGIEASQSIEERATEELARELEECKQQKECEEKRAQTAEKRVQSVESELTKMERERDKWKSYGSGAAKKSDEDGQQILQLKEEVAHLQAEVSHLHGVTNSQFQAISQCNAEKDHLLKENGLLKLENGDILQEKEILLREKEDLEGRIATARRCNEAQQQILNVNCPGTYAAPYAVTDSSASINSVSTNSD